VSATPQNERQGPPEARHEVLAGAAVPSTPTIARTLSTPEPAPTPNANDAIWHLVIQDMHKRDVMGRRKYGTPLQAFNGRDALKDAYQEALDLCVYLRQALRERDGV